MKTISSYVGQYIKTKPFLQSALCQGIINLTSLSRIIKPELEKTLKKHVKEGAIVMALKRLSVEMEFSITHKIVGVLHKIGDITVRSEITDYTFSISEKALKKQAELIQKASSFKGAFYTSSRGVEEITIVVSKSLNVLVEELFQGENCVQKTENLASVTLKLPEENVKISGLYYFIFQRLAWDNIIVKEVISTSNEFTLVVSEEQLERTFSVVKALKKV